MRLILKQIWSFCDIVIHVAVCAFALVLTRILTELYKPKPDSPNYAEPWVDGARITTLLLFIHLGFYLGIRNGFRHEYMNACISVINDDITEDVQLRLLMEKRIFEQLTRKHGKNFVNRVHQHEQVLNKNPIQPVAAAVAEGGCCRKKKKVPPAPVPNTVAAPKQVSKKSQKDQINAAKV